MAINIPVKLDGASALFAAMDRLDSSTDKLRGAISDLASALGKASGGGNQMAQSINRVKNAAQQASGPMQRLQQAVQSYQDALRSGDPSRIFDARYNLLQRQRSVQRAQNAMNPPSFGSRLAQAIFSTRVGFGSGGMQVAPLVGRVMQLFGSASAGFSAALGVASAAVAAFVMAMRAAIGSLTDISKVRAQTGGTLGQTQALRRLSDALGYDAAGAANSFMQRYGGGGTNSAARYLDRLNKIANMPNEQMARRQAKIWQMPEAMQLRDMSPDVRNRLLNQQANVKQSDVRAAADFNAELGMLKQSFEELLYALAPIIRFINMLIRAVTVVIGWIKKLWDLIPSWMKGIGALFDDKATGNAQNASLDKNTQAVQDNTRALENFRQIFGGGQRAQGAIPNSWGYETMRRAALGQAANLGAFSL